MMYVRFLLSLRTWETLFERGIDIRYETVEIWRKAVVFSGPTIERCRAAGYEAMLNMIDRLRNGSRRSVQHGLHAPKLELTWGESHARTRSRQRTGCRSA
jgi:hypothetical protein